MKELTHTFAALVDPTRSPGAVAKQFTAAAVLLLARDGKLSLDDPARKYLPELPPSAAEVTIRQMLNHTAGLRDWEWTQINKRRANGYTRGADDVARQMSIENVYGNGGPRALSRPSGVGWR